MLESLGPVDIVGVRVNKAMRMKEGIRPIASSSTKFKVKINDCTNFCLFV